MGSNRVIRLVFEAIVLVAVAVVLASIGVSTAVYAGVIIGVLLVLAGIEMLVFGLRPPRREAKKEALPVHEGGGVRDEPLPEPQEPEEAPLEPETPVVAIAEPEPEPEREPEPEPEPVPEREHEPEPEPVELVVVPPLPPEPKPELVPVGPPEADGGAIFELPLRGGTRGWNLWDLERRARERYGEDHYRDEEWSALFVYLREYASPDGMLPADFDDLIRSSFGELLTAGRL
jgi:hypothetical protein